jgi:hypothetical protein
MINVVVRLDGLNALQLSKDGKASVADLQEEILRRLRDMDKLKPGSDYTLKFQGGLYPDPDTQIVRMAPLSYTPLTVELVEC